MNLTVLYCGVDTIEATYVGELVEGLSGELALCKARAQATNTPEPFPLAGEPFWVGDKGQGKYAWVLADPRMLIRVSAATNGGPPPISVKLRASALASYGHESLWQQSCAVVAQLGTFVPNGLSRIDLCCDVQGFDFTDDDFARMVCPASFRAIIKEADGVTYQLGKGDVVLRVYRKDAQLKAKNKLSYAKLWERHPDYDPEAPVWRIEVQLRGKALTELNARNVEGAFGKLPALWASGMEWAQLRIPTGDSTKARWPVDPVWQVLTGVWGDMGPEPRIRRAARLEREERALSRMLGVVATLGAYSGQSDLVGTLVVAVPQLEQLIKERGLDYAELVEGKAARIGFDEEVEL